MISSDSEILTDQPANAVAKLPLLAAIVALIGLGDAIYLTIHHYTGEKVPCSIVEGCDQVLTSAWAEVGGVPLAAFGAAAYFAAFAFSILAAFGNHSMWMLFGIQVSLMVAFTAWLIYLQAFVIEAFCQFCLLSAATTLVMFIILPRFKIPTPPLIHYNLVGASNFKNRANKVMSGKLH